MLGKIPSRDTRTVVDSLIKLAKKLHSQARLNYVARELNERPRETLGFETPKERFQACVASTD
jgi:IS30 family transposase